MNIGLLMGDRMAKVFISFVHEDEIVASAVKHVLEMQFDSVLNRGDVFLSSDLPYGENWMDRIKKELKDCRVLVSLLSKRSVERPWIHFEAGVAWVEGKLLVAYYGNLNIADIPRPYSDFVSVDLQKKPHGLIQGVERFLPKKELPRIGRALADSFKPENPTEALTDALALFRDQE
jgi:TIR domain-containing protein